MLALRPYEQGDQDPKDAVGKGKKFLSPISKLKSQNKLAVFSTSHPSHG